MPDASPAAAIASLRGVPTTVTRSPWPSPVVAPSAPPRSTPAFWTAVPLGLLTAARSSVDSRRDGVGDGPVRIVDAHPVVAAVRLDADALDRGPREAEVGRPVVAEIHLEDGGVPRREPKCDRIVRSGPLHAQAVM